MGVLARYFPHIVQHLYVMESRGDTLQRPKNPHRCTLAYHFYCNHHNVVWLSAIPLDYFPSFQLLSSTSLPIQVFLAWRIRQFSGSTAIFFLLLALSIAQGTMGVVVGVAAVPVNE